MTDEFYFCERCSWRVEEYDQGPWHCEAPGPCPLKTIEALLLKLE